MKQQSSIGLGQSIIIILVAALAMAASLFTLQLLIQMAQPLIGSFKASLPIFRTGYFSLH